MMCLLNLEILCQGVFELPVVCLLTRQTCVELCRWQNSVHACNKNCSVGGHFGQR